MHRNTEEFLYTMLWAANMLSRPTLRNLTDSYETWAYRNGIRQRLTRLEAQALIERKARQDRVYRLTRAGVLAAIGGRNPEEHWQRPWDGTWRLALFDLPVARKPDRSHLRQFFRSRGFGCLQGSVWITPHPVTDVQDIMSTGDVNVGVLTFFEGRPCASERDSDIVTTAWNFARINDHYRLYRGILARRPSGALANPATMKAFQSWLRNEREAWIDAISLDPLLTKVLLPKEYQGIDAWREKQKIMTKAGKQIRAFTP